MDDDYITQGLVPFGKWRGQRLADVKQDSEYVEWLIKQTWFQVRYRDIYEYVTDKITLEGLICRYQERKQVARKKARHDRMWNRAIDQKDEKYAYRLMDRRMGGLTLWEDYPELCDEIVKRYYPRVYDL